MHVIVRERWRSAVLLAVLLHAFVLGIAGLLLPDEEEMPGGVQELAWLDVSDAEETAERVPAPVQETPQPPADEAIKEGSHGQPVSFEYIKEKNPDWLFVLDRSAAIGEEGQAAREVLNNPLVAQSTAWKKGQVVYLPPETYLAAGGAQELLNAGNLLKDAFSQAK